MNTNLQVFVAALVMTGACASLASTRYVDVNSTNATPPYTNWTTAATNIHDAVDAAVAGDEVVVTNGFYSPVTVAKQLNLRSVNGPQFTVIGGGHYARCVYLTSGASLSGFTLRDGYVSEPFLSRLHSIMSFLTLPQVRVAISGSLADG